MEFCLRSATVSPELRIGLTIGFLGGMITLEKVKVMRYTHPHAE
jgi:hypothetical protein